MSIKEGNFSVLKRVAIVYSSLFILTGILGIIFLLMVNNIPIIIDPIEQIILILIGVIFLRGYLGLRAGKISGKAFLFVGTIIGFVLGTLAFLEFLFIGLIGGLLNETTLHDFVTRLFSYFFNPAILLGFLVFIPHIIIKHREISLVD